MKEMKNMKQKKEKYEEKRQNKGKYILKDKLNKIENNLHIRDVKTTYRKRMERGKKRNKKRKYMGKKEKNKKK